MEEHVIVDSSFSAIMNAPFEQIDIPSWCFSLPDDEYQALFTPAELDRVSVSQTHLLQQPQQRRAFRGLAVRARTSGCLLPVKSSNKF